MYRVAVIQNESEMLRAGYTNITPKLNAIKRFTNYSFEMFNVVNFQKLFIEGENNLLNFDSLIITTNATSDKTVLYKLQENKNLIDKFILCGKGLFISSQKKLSTSKFEINNLDGRTLFLPDLYDFYTVERPKDEKDSGIGEITLNNNEEHIILNYPTKVTTDLTKNHCETNEFKRHYYRSHIIPKTNGAYLPIFVDSSYENVNNRSLLLLNLVPQNGERIVISTIAIDWEFHENLLTNIITYITEGLPKVAFIDNENVKHGDFDFLLTSAKLSKISHIIYNDVSSIKSELFYIHNTYIFSPDWKEIDISNFIKRINIKNQNNEAKKSYIRVYYFKLIDNILTLTQFSNFSTIDLITDSSILWVNSKFNGGMWQGSFWVTYDILIMLNDIGIDIKSYIIPILKDIRKHYADFSYDGVTGATCGLIELIFLFEKKYNDELIKEGFTESDLKGMLNYIIQKYETQSSYDKQTVILTLSKFYKDIFISKKINIAKEKYTELFNHVISKFNIDETLSEEFSEIDICRNLSICLLCKDKFIEINNLLSLLERIQTPSGKWTNTGRTAHVLVFLLKNMETFNTNLENVSIIDKMIYNGILYLRAEYNLKNASWDNDLQASAKAIHAIGLYNKKFQYSTQDFFKTLEVESDKIYSASVIHNVSESMRNLRQQSNEQILIIDHLRIENETNKVQLEEQKRKIDESETYENNMVKRMIRIQTATVISSSLLITFVMYLTILYPARILQELRSLDIKGIILGFVVALILTNLAQKSTNKNEYIENYKKKKKENK